MVTGTSVVRLVATSCTLSLPLSRLAEYHQTCIEQEGARRRCFAWQP